MSSVTASNSMIEMFDYPWTYFITLANRRGWKSSNIGMNIFDGWMKRFGNDIETSYLSICTRGTKGGAYHIHALVEGEFQIGHAIDNWDHSTGRVQCQPYDPKKKGLSYICNHYTDNPYAMDNRDWDFRISDSLKNRAQEDIAALLTE
jgi:hypothetical protein